MSVEVSIDVDDLKVPGIAGYTPVLGQTKPAGESLTTLEVIDNMALSYLKQRNHSVQLANDTEVILTKLQYNGTLIIEDNGIPTGSTLTLTLPAPSSEGCRLTVINSTAYELNVTYPAFGEDPYKVYPNKAKEFVQTASKWFELGAPAVKDGSLYF